uniref:shikimate dehydrogenase n=1 Tax=Eubacterium cellulosolvens TaxID=29322 RepID=UPI0004813DB6|nr:shikimate dehydrogenase [[Eubacterium] cellulosolvens]
MNNSITGRTALTGLLGSPVAHSLSPMMHNDSFRHLGLDYVYLCFDVNEDNLKEAVNGLKICGIRGFNLTMPDKNRMAELADALSPAAELIGAVNTVVNDNGRLVGHNTDGVGFIRSLADYGFSPKGKTVTLLGAGGAATAIAAQAALDGVKELRIFARPNSRFHERTVRLVDDINRQTGCVCTLSDLTDTTALRSSLAESALLVNGTPVGMAPDTEISVITDPSMFHKDLFVSDIIYNPRETRLMRLAKEAGCRTSNGLFMLLYQGAEAFRLWTGQEMPTDLIKERYFSD